MADYVSNIPSYLLNPGATNYVIVSNGIDQTPSWQELQSPEIPVGSIIPWLKTFQAISSGTTTGTTADKLVDSGATFQTDGVSTYMVIHNTTDDIFTHVSAVDSETQLSVNDDIFTSGENYVVYATTRLSDYWVECNGQVLSDALSVYDGATIPDLNGDSGTPRFLRGSTTSGTTGGSEQHSHSIPTSGGATSTGGSNLLGGSTTGNTSTLPSYYEVVYVMRIK